MEDILTDLELYEYVNQSNSAPDAQLEVQLTNQKDENGKLIPDTTEMQDNPKYPKWCKTDWKALLNICL